jgi:RNA polymerase II subunit A-like phosphatase
MRLWTPESLLYPITVTKLLRKPGDDIDINAPLFSYEYKSTRLEYDEETREDKPVTRTGLSNFESELEGKIETLDVRVGQVIARRTAVAQIEEACTHESQFGGMCIECGKDMSERTTYNQTVAGTSRATINTVHGRTELLISENEAAKIDEEARRRLLDSRKLSLVVDLDQTIIQANVEPTIGEWKNDPTNPNWKALQDVCMFQLVDDGRTWYYVKLRPGLRDFLRDMSELYEMHIYTMGTRAYADNIAKIVDPERQIFGDRILSRDENGSITAKNLKRLFPVDTRMVVIIDDRADVWHWTPNLIKVNAFEFFPGVGDINSMFLPKRQEMERAPHMERVPSKKSTETTDGNDVTLSDTNGAGSAIDQIVSMAGKQDAKSVKEKSEEQEQTIAAQVEDRPLLQKQKILDELENEAKASPATEAAAELLAENGEIKKTAPTETPNVHKYRSNLLQDDDEELFYLERHLRTIHGAYFDQLDQTSAGTKGGRIAELRPGHGKKRSIDELDSIPDAAPIMQSMKTKVLAGVHIVFSGVIPLGQDLNTNDTAIWAKSFGATITDNITKKTTHVIASPERRTAKVRQAAKKSGRIAIVSTNWLNSCFMQWKKVDESPYRIHSDAPVNGAGGLPENFEAKAYELSSSDDEAAHTETEVEDEPTGNGVPDPGFDTDTDPETEELKQYMPSLDRQDSSPTEGEIPDNWGEVDAELEEFLASGDDTETETEDGYNTDGGDSDAGSVRSEVPTSDARIISGQKKRKADESETEEALETSRLQKRKREALERTSSLTKVVVGTATPEGDDDGAAAAEESEGDDDLEAMLAAEMERQSEEDGEDNDEGDDEKKAAEEP